MKKSYPELPDGSVLIEGRKYRTGFLKADWSIDDGDEQLSYNKLKLKIKRENQIFLSGIIYHYTTIPGFKGIIDSGGFWASDNRFMNDTEELHHGFKLVKNIIERLENREDIEGFKEVLRISLGSLPDPLKKSSLVTCFSLSRDSLEQWRGYGPSGGICIGLKASISESKKPLIIAPDLLLHKVSYGRHEKVARILSIVRRFKKEYILDKGAMDVWPDDHNKNYADALQGWLIYAYVLFKNEAFRSEKEIRYVIPPAHADRFKAGIEFRPSSIGLIPYVNTSGYTDKSKNIPISEVIIGPSPNQKLIASSIDTFLARKGYDNVEINISNVPFRSI